MAVKPIPDGYTSVTAYLAIDGAAEAIAFYQKAFNAVEIMRMEGPDKRIGHAEIQLGNARVMLADEFPEMMIRSPKSLGGAGVSLILYVDNVDVTFPQAIAAGGTEIRAVQDQFYGDRSGSLKDPFGHTWTISTHIADYSEEELRERAAAAMK
ncbi:PhnB protein; putative DNA binding 3-demethylubiquinone-9 3-methyltransferase domain protein [Collimonas arenae]|uniref:PhnB protein putative DNA binding 3-demethylubiquinone-9 3-methyltransferase domain protein n=1 Tax=Collimonas arenae TaxID=279058 RepID=A0A0A1FC11_9BURK|nr:VOC family protein [Collimonas arenae]AIY41285.1 PhnB protein; putative DNA binding 3-demethylubiquinone-9 3-methyltransferase domain protein [Collimonas arenae]